MFFVCVHIVDELFPHLFALLCVSPAQDRLEEEYAQYGEYHYQLDSDNKP